MGAGKHPHATAVLIGIVIHGGARVLVARRQTPAPAHAGLQVYMYDVYERLWHSLQTAAILLLIFTGLIIHRPDQFGLFSFAYVVQVHNVLAAVLPLQIITGALMWVTPTAADDHLRYTFTAALGANYLWAEPQPPKHLRGLFFTHPTA